MKLDKILIALALFGAVSCSSSKEATVATADQSIDIEVPCGGLEFTTSAEYFRANASGISNSLEISKQKAMTAARQQLALSMEATVKTVTDSYVSSYEENANEEARSRYQGLTREAAKQTLTGIRTICQKVKQAPDGKYTTYVAIELAGTELLNQIQNQISDDSKLRTDFEYEKFKAVFEEEMANL
ncbi:MAG: hypothetical protein R3Y61_05845 [Rikenellaceae bacterium]